MRRVSHGELSRVVADCLVDGEPAASAYDVELLIAAVELAQLRQELTVRWMEWESRLGVAIRQGGPPPPVPAMDAQSPEFWVSRLLAEAAEAQAWERHRWPALHGLLAQVLPDGRLFARCSILLIAVPELAPLAISP